MSGLAEQTVQVPILGLNQKAPRLAGPIGRLSDAEDCIFDKFADGFIQVSPRNGTTPVTTTWINSSNGSSQSSFLASDTPELMTTVNGDLAVIGRSGNVYIQTSPSGQWLGYTGPKPIVGRPQIKQLITSVGRAIRIDRATSAINGNVMYVWTNDIDSDTYAAVFAPDNSIVNGPFKILAHSANQAISRVVYGTDASHNPCFYVATHNGNTGLTCRAYDQNGNLVTAAFAIGSLDNNYDSWDFRWSFDINQAILVRGSTGSPQTHLTVYGLLANIGGGSIAETNGNITLSTDCRNGVAFLDNYLTDFPNTLIFGYIDSTAANYLVYTLSLAGSTINFTARFSSTQGFIPASNIVQYVGCVVGTVTINTSSFNVGYAANNGSGMFSGTVWTVSAFNVGFTNTTGTLRGVIPISRTAQRNGRTFFAAYFPSSAGATFIGNLGNRAGNPRNFLVDAMSGQICGHFAQLVAEANWLWSFTLPITHTQFGTFFASSTQSDSTGAYIPFSIRTSSQLAATGASSGVIQLYAFLSVLGIASYGVLAAPGEPITDVDTTILPGPLPIQIDTSGPRPAGIEAPAEAPTALSETSGGPFLAGDVRSYVIVYERTNKNGRKVRSDSSISFQYTTVGAGVKHVLTIPTLRTTLHSDVIISVYRTTFVNGQQVLTHHKVTSDAAPLMNNPAVDTVTFTDSVTDAVAIYNEVLYGGSGAFLPSAGGGDGSQLAHALPRGIQTGGQWLDRLFAIADDGNVYFTPPNDPTSGKWFTDFLFISIPAICANQLDSRLIVSVPGDLYSIDGTGLPDATGTGSISTPTLLAHFFSPQTNVNGPNALSTALHGACRYGLVFSAEDNTIWLLDRGLNCQPLSLNVEDSLGSITNQVAFTDTRMILSDGAHGGAVYDWIAQQWAHWTKTGDLIVNVGNSVYGLFFGSPPALAVFATSSTDYTGANVSYTVELADIAFSTIAGCQMLWSLLADGVWHSQSQITMIVTPDGVPALAETFNEILNAPPSGDRPRTWFQPKQMETSTVDVKVTVAPSGISGLPGLFSLQTIGASLGVIQGQRRYGNYNIGAPTSD